MFNLKCPKCLRLAISPYRYLLPNIPKKPFTCLRCKQMVQAYWKPSWWIVLWVILIVAIIPVAMILSDDSVSNFLVVVVVGGFYLACLSCYRCK